METSLSSLENIHTFTPAVQDRVVQWIDTTAYVPLLSAITAITSFIIRGLATLFLSSATVQSNILLYELCSKSLFNNVLHIIPGLGNLVEVIFGESYSARILRRIESSPKYFLLLSSDQQKDPSTVLAAAERNPDILKYVNSEILQSPSMINTLLIKAPKAAQYIADEIYGTLPNKSKLCVEAQLLLLESFSCKKNDSHKGMIDAKRIATECHQAIATAIGDSANRALSSPMQQACQKYFQCISKNSLSHIFAEEQVERA